MKYIILFTSIVLSVLTPFSSKHTSNPAPSSPQTVPAPPYKIFIPEIASGTSAPPAIHAMRVQYQNYQTSRTEVPAVEAVLRSAHVNMVSLAAGRVEWAYFKWLDHPEYQSGDVKDSGIDFLSEDSKIYGQFAHIDAVIDVLSPNYILAHPDTAAINALGQRSQDLVGTMELVNGNYGKLLLSMVEYIAANYPQVNSISLTELSYRLDGYGPNEKASYLAYTGRSDWPRQSNGQINIDEPSIGDWRSHLLAAYLGKLAAAAHAHGKQFFFDVSMSRNNLSQATNENGTRYDLMLAQVDKLVVWGYYYLDNYPPEFLQTAAQYLKSFGPDRIIMSIGLWGPTSALMSPDLLQRGLQASQAGGISNIWITPSILMDNNLWQVLDNNWK